MAISAVATGTIPVPVVSQPLASGDIVGLRLQNTGSVAENAGYIMFGEVFKLGALLPTDSLVARIGGVNYAVQMDVKATNSDGSVRQAVLTLQAPAIATGATVDVMLAKGTASAAPSVSKLLASGYDTSVAFTFHNADGTTTTASASAAAALSAALAAGGVSNWLTGPQVNEYDVVTTVDGGKLKVEFDIRAYSDGSTITDVIFDNSWMFSSGKSSLNYDVTISQGGKTAYSASNVNQYLYSMWDHQIASPGTISPNLQYDVSYLIAAADLPAYDPSYGVSGTTIQTNYAALNPSTSTGYGSTGPLGTAEVQTAMPMVGARPDLATQPDWVSQWVLAQSATAESVMMANADASGGVPWRLTDESTNKPLNGQTYPLSGKTTGI